MSSESDGEYSEIEEEPRLKYKRIGNNILGLVRSRRLRPGVINEFKLYNRDSIRECFGAIICVARIVFE